MPARPSWEGHLRLSIAEKHKGRVIKPAKPANDDTKVVDLMAALRDSLTRRTAA